MKKILDGSAKGSADASRPKKTAEDFMRRVRDGAIVEWHIHNCSMCGYPCGFLFEDGRVRYDSGCHCSYQPPRSSSFEEVAQLFNMQDSPKVIEAYSKMWGFEAASASVSASEPSKPSRKPTVVSPDAEGG